MTTTTEPELTACPQWCDADHEARHADDIWSDSWTRHDGVVGEGIDTKTHGPLYQVTLEEASDGTRPYAHLEASVLSADQAEAFGLALIRGTHLLRERLDADEKTIPTSFADVSG